MIFQVALMVIEFFLSRAKNKALYEKSFQEFLEKHVNAQPAEHRAQWLSLKERLKAKTEQK